jgi:hypothetical protein
VHLGAFSKLAVHEEKAGGFPILMSCRCFHLQILLTIRKAKRVIHLEGLSFCPKSKSDQTLTADSGVNLPWLSRFERSRLTISDS